LKGFDKIKVFAMPVTEDVAANYFDIVRNPMDLQTMSIKASDFCMCYFPACIIRVHITQAGRGQYKSLQLLRQDFELMCMNAIEFNKPGDEYWKAAAAFFVM